MSHDGRRCPSVEQAPESPESAGAWRAACSALVPVDGHVRVDMGAAIALAAARGIAPAVAAHLLGDIATGIAEAQADAQRANAL